MRSANAFDARDGCGTDSAVAEVCGYGRIDMSTKYFCDVCSIEMTKFDHKRIKLNLSPVAIEIHTAINGAWNGGHKCHKCVKRVIAEGKSVVEFEFNPSDIVA